MLFSGLKKIASIIVMLTAAPVALPPESAQYRLTVLADKELKPAELINSYKHYNFSPLWLKTDNKNVYGFIGSNYQRLRIKLLTVRPDPQQAGRYLVTGKSKVGETILPFQGTFTLLHVREATTVPVGLDGASASAVKAGLVLAEYNLHEPESVFSAGTFQGVLRTNWYLDRNKRMQYDAINSYSDGFSNNQYVGTWKSYKSGLVKRSNWGDYRIPNCGDLDQGAGEFSPIDKYSANGWQSYRSAWFENNLIARKLEAGQWWK